MKQKVVASLFALFFAIPFGAVGLGAAYLMAAMIYDGARARDWVLVKAEVTGPASYRYTIGGRTIEGTRLGTLRIGGTSDVDDFDDRVGSMLAEGREQKKPITVFVNPDDPSEAMVDRAIRWGLLAFLTPFAVAFGGVGLGALWLVRRLFTDEEADPRRAKAQAAMADAASGAGGLWFFAIVWNAISFPAAMIAIPQGIAEGEWGVLFILLFPIIGIGVLWAAISATFERLRRGGAPAARRLNKQRRPT
jgi:hypothetical protein